MKTLGGLYAIADTSLLTTEFFSVKVRQALRGGAGIIQYRDKSNDTKRRYSQAQIMVNICREFDAVSIINDDIQLAELVNADGVHLGADDDSIASARRVLGEKTIIGISCYNQLSLAHKAVDAGANYVAFGAVYPSQVKPDAVNASLVFLAEARQVIKCPICAIGGIDETNLGGVIKTGVDMAAVISAVFGSNDPEKSALQLSCQFS